MTLTLNQLAGITGGSLQGSNQSFDDVTTDTRNVSPGALFIALQGARFDAHDFVEEAIAKGAAAVLVSKPLALTVPQVVVQDTRLALGKLAGWVREQCSVRLVALTGSSGKTSVKEMVASILRTCGETLFTEGNLNNDIGVPLTLLRLNEKHQYAVIELGANHQGEIAYTVNLARPDTALINNLAAAHLEGFGSLAGVAKAKGEIFHGLSPHGTAVINADSHDWLNWQALLHHQRVWRFSSRQPTDSDFCASEICLTPQGTRFTLHTPAGDVAITLPLPGRHNVANALAAAALALSVGAPLNAVQRGLAVLKAVPGRLFPVELHPGQLLLDDSYNANVGSVMAAVEVLAEMPGFRVLVIGDMAELGEEAAACHRKVGDALRLADVDKVLSVGSLSKHISDASGSGKGEHFTIKRALTERLHMLLSEHEEMTILVKGSRNAAMEQVVRSIKEKGAC